MYVAEPEVLRWIENDGYTVYMKQTSLHIGVTVLSISVSHSLGTHFYANRKWAI